MDGFISLSVDDLKSANGVSNLNIMLQKLFNSATGDGNTIQDSTGYGSPNGVVTAGIGSTYRQIDGSGATAFWTKGSGTGNTGWINPPTYPLSAANGGTGGTTGFPYVKVTNTQSQNVAGGNTTSGAWTTLVLNTKDTDSGSIASLSSNQITLPAGTYLVNSVTPFYVSSALSVNCQTRLQNITDSSLILTGTSNVVVNTVGSNEIAPSFVKGQFTLSGSKALALQYQVSVSVTNGQGAPCNFGSEVYSTIEFLKVG